MDNEKILKALVRRAETFYECNRGPRPSGAMIKLPDGKFLHGDVAPTPGSDSCLDADCMMVDGHCVRNIHAEVDALLRCAWRGWATVGSTMYSINKPCYNCSIACIKAGVKRIVYAAVAYDEERTRLALEAAGVECIHVPIT